MAISRMKKLTAFCLTDDADRLLHSLMKLRCVEVSAVGGGVPDTATPDASVAIGCTQQCVLDPPRDLAGREVLSADLARTHDALELLQKHAVKSKNLIKPLHRADLDEFMSDGRATRAVELVDEVIALRARLAEMKTERARLSADAELCAAWREYDMPLSYTGTRHTAAELGTLPSGIDTEGLKLALSEENAVLYKVNEDTTAIYVAVLLLSDSDDEVNRLLSSAGFLRTSFREMKDTPELELARAESGIAALDAESEEIRIKLNALSARLREAEVLYDAQRTALDAATCAGTLPGTARSRMLTGWVPEEAERRVTGVLEAFGCAYELTDPTAEDNPPILLKNKSFFASFEWVMGMYSYPVYGSYDPTAIMGIFYLIIFGMMFADAGYGLLLSAACFTAVRLLPVREGMKRFLSMFGWCGLSCIVWGVLFGSWFGDFPIALMNNVIGIEAPVTLAVLFDPLAEPMSFLILSLGVGAVHLVAGMAVQFYMLARRGKLLDAIFDIGSWWLLFAGMGLLFAIPAVGKWVAVAGVAALILTQGRREKNIVMKLFKGVGSLYSIINYVSDLLSYSRIMALGLASAVIAQVVNILGTMGGPTVVGLIVLVIAFIVGHLLNLAINLLGTFVHTSRLQYIEFFGKFFEDGGEAFKPLSESSVYTEAPAAQNTVTK